MIFITTLSFCSDSWIQDEGDVEFDAIADYVFLVISPLSDCGGWIAHTSW